jgi:hypothetical protein
MKLLKMVFRTQSWENQKETSAVKEGMEPNLQYLDNVLFTTT